MKTNELTTEKVMSLVKYYEDSAYLDSRSVTSRDNDPCENDEVYNKAVEIADEALIGYEYIEDEDCGNYCRAIWHKIS